MKLRVDPRLEALLVLLRELSLSSGILAAAFALLIRGPAMALLKLFLTTGAESSLDFLLAGYNGFLFAKLTLYFLFGSGLDWGMVRLLFARMLVCEFVLLLSELFASFAFCAIIFCLWIKDIRFPRMFGWEEVSSLLTEFFFSLLVCRITLLICLNFWVPAPATYAKNKNRWM